jgi:DNA uptake protein ComE-like DNA-binding protein
MSGLRAATEWMENGQVRAGMQWAISAAAILCVCLCGPAQGQNQDRDSLGVPKTSASAPPPEQRVDINHASMAQLLKVPGLTQGWAVRVVRFRPYRTKQDLFDKGIVSSEVYDRIKDFIIAHHDKQ